MFSEDTPFHRLAVNVQNYEHFLSTSTTQASSIVHHLLGDPWSSIPPLTSKLAAIYSYQVSALLATYRLLDLELLHSGPKSPLLFPPSYSNTITLETVGKAKVKDRWKKLVNWQQLLIKFRDCYNNVSVKEEDLVLVDESPFKGCLAHLQGLADSHSNQKLINVVQNFRRAALHWTVLHEMIHRDVNELAVMPENLVGIIDQKALRQLNETYQPHTREKIQTYLRQHGRGELVLPLHLSLMLTPCFLLMLTPLVKSKFPRQTIYQLSCALGNQKPDILTRVEKEIWDAFSAIREDSSMPVVHKAFRQLVNSIAVVEAINMSPTDPAFSFFRASNLMPVHGVVEMDGDEDEPQINQNGSTAGKVAQQCTDADVEGSMDSESPDNDRGNNHSQWNAENANEPSRQQEHRSAHKEDGHGSGNVQVDHDINIDNPSGGGPGEGVDHDINMDMGNLNNGKDDEDDNGNSQSTEKADHNNDKGTGDSDNSSRAEDSEEADLHVNNDTADSSKNNDGSKKSKTLTLPPRVVEKRKQQEIQYTEIRDRAKRRKARKSNLDNVQEQGPRWVKLEEDIFVETPSLNLDLSAKIKPKLRMGRTMKAWGPEGQTLEFQPLCHDRETLEQLQYLFTRIEEGYEEGLPLYVKDDKQTALKESIFKIMNEAEFFQMEPSNVQEILRERHIVVTGIRHQAKNFEEALLDIAPLDWVTGIQDLSIPDGPDRTHMGTVSDILKASRSASSKILNCLSFKNPWAGIQPSSFSSDSHALSTVYNQEGWVKGSTPVEHLHWSLAATKDAFHPWHIDSDGYGTFVNVIAGAKWWIVARPKGGLNADSINTTSIFPDEKYQDKLDFEAILLQPGSELIMRPNTLHTVYTPEHSVCRGGHFLATSTMADTFSALVHTFICALTITNEAYNESRFILMKMIMFYHTAFVKQVGISSSAKAHVLDITNEQTFIDFLVVCSLGVLLNVLCHLTYSPAGMDQEWPMDDTQARLWDQCDINGLSEDERKQLCLARGQSIELVLWLSMTYTTGIRDTPIQGIFSRVLVDICKMICDYKWQADKHKVPYYPNFTLAQLKVQTHAVLQLVVEKVDPFLGTSESDRLDWDAREWELPTTDNISQSLLPQVTGIKISKSSALPYKRKHQSELFKVGETILD